MRKNGEVTQDDTTASMIFSFADIIAYTTSFMTLKAGDVICTGTPVKSVPKVEPPIWLKPGDTIDITDITTTATTGLHASDDHSLWPRWPRYGPNQYR